MSNNNLDIEIPLKDRMVVYVGVFIVLLVSWLYIIGMGWHMNTLPFVENSAMGMSMDKSMKMDQDVSFLSSILSWMPPMHGAWQTYDFLLLFLMWSVMMIAMMTPSILPMLMLFTTLSVRKREQGQDSASTLILLLGYLFSWVIFSLAITIPQYFMHKSGLLNPMM